MPRVPRSAAGYLVTANPARHRQLVPPPGGGALGQPGPRPPHPRADRGDAAAHPRSIEQIQLDIVSSPTASFCGCGCRSSRRPRSPTGCAAGTAPPAPATTGLLAGARPAARAGEELHTALLGPEAEPFGWYNDDEALQAALGAGPCAIWTRAGLGDKAALLARAETRAVDWMAKQPRTWGAFDRTQIHHAFGVQPGALRWLFDPPQHDQGGCGACVRVGDPAHGQKHAARSRLGRP